MERIRSDAAPAPVGAYSQGVIHEGWIFVSGQIPLDPATGALVEGDIEEQTERVLASVAAVLEAGGASLRDVVKTTVYLADLSLFARMNTVYGRHFDGDPPPARATVPVAALPLGALVEIDAIAIAPR